MHRLTGSLQRYTIRTYVLLHGRTSQGGKRENPRLPRRKEQYTPVENDAASGSSLRWAVGAEDRYPYGTGSSADGRPGRGRNAPQGAESGGTLPERTLGWECPDGSTYLLPELARREVEPVLGPGGLNGVSSRTLHE
jgi:hypothetical protein